MTNKLLKSVLSIGAVLAASGFAMQAQAHCVNETIATANPSAYQQDAYMFVCPANTVRVQGRASLSSGTQLAYQIAKGGFTSASVIDTTTGNGTCQLIPGGGPGGKDWEQVTAGATANINVNGGPGVYSLLVSKSTTAAASYGIEFHCMDSAGIELQPPVVWEQGGPGSVAGTGLTDALDFVANSNVLANDTNKDVNLVINH